MVGDQGTDTVATTVTTEGGSNDSTGLGATGEGQTTNDSDVTGDTEVTGDVASAEGAAQPVYTPNFKFKFKDKDLEFDDWAKGAIKDAETEKKVRDLYTRANGLEVTKQKADSLATENQELKQQVANTDQFLDRVGQYVAREDFDSFFEELKIPPEKILKYAIGLAERENWTEQQKAEWTASRTARREADQYKAQYEETHSAMNQLKVQRREFELQQIMSRQDVAQAVQAYNTGMANPSAFRDLVIQIGSAAAARGVDLPAETAVAEAMRYLRGANPNLGQAPQRQVVQHTDKPVIPSIQGRGTSPVKPAIKSLDDVRKLAREREAQGI